MMTGTITAFLEADFTADEMNKLLCVQLPAFFVYKWIYTTLYRRYILRFLGAHKSF
jgi:hypothetical protein